MTSAVPTKRWLQVAVLGAVGVAAMVGLVLFAYELALARVPEHRAALERLVQAQTGLDVRFDELGLRWGWYGPEAVFRRVELDRPGSSDALLRAPQLVVGFDAWRTLRSGHPEAGRIELVAPDIDFVGAANGPGRPRRAEPASASHSALAGRSSGLERVAVLQRWRGGRIDIEGGTLRLPDPGGNEGALTLQIRHATLRRSDGEWNVLGLVFLPDRIGRTARVVLRVKGDLGRPEALGGSLHFEGSRLLLPGCRDLLAGAPELARYLPRAGNGDLTVDLDFDRGNILRASGSLGAAGLVFDALRGGSDLVLDRLRGNWHVVRRGVDWRIRVDSLAFAKGARPAALIIDTGEMINRRSDAASVGGWIMAPGVSQRWLRGSLEQAPLESVVAVARWLAPDLALAGIQLDGQARKVTFDWAPERPTGQRLITSARFDDVTLVPRSQDFTLSGLGVRVDGNERQLTIDVHARAARLELAQSRADPLAGIRVGSTLRLDSTPDGWRLATHDFLLDHAGASLSLSGEIRGRESGPAPRPTPEIAASGTLRGADIPFVERLLGASTAQAFGAVASRLTAGQIQDAQFELRGPIDQLPFGARGGFTGSLTLREAMLSGGGLWPDARGIAARVEWRGARIQAAIDAGHAGPFQLESATAQWDAAGANPTVLTGRVSGRLEAALAWIRNHPQLHDYAPELTDVSASGPADFDFNVAMAPDRQGWRQPQVTARVLTTIDGAKLTAIAGLPPLENVRGTFVFDAGHVQHSVLAGVWLGGPVTLRVGERREKGARVIAVGAQGVVSAQQLASLANAPGTAQGSTVWTGELAYLPATASQPSRWRMRGDSALLGVASSLPEPLAKRASSVLPVHFAVSGTENAAQMSASLGDRIRGSFDLLRHADVGWGVERGAVRLGVAAVPMPPEAVVMVQGRVNQLDLAAYALAWQRLRQDMLPAIRAQLVVGKLLAADQSYDEVTLHAERNDALTELSIQSAAVAGIARWPSASSSTGRPHNAGAAAGAEIRLTRLTLPTRGLPSAGLGLVGALAPSTVVSVDELSWRGRSLGRLSAMVTAQGQIVAVDDVRLVNSSQEARGALRCQTELPACLVTFAVASTDAAATLEDFGFTPDLTASQASLRGDLEWRPVSHDSWLGGLRGTLSMRIAAGALRGGRADELAEKGDDNLQRPFGLLAVPALVGGLDETESGAPLAQQPRGLRFSHLEADFEVQDGQATTSNLHFDGDAEILMRGRTGLVARDYDQQVWVLRGEERLPAAIRHFGATPNVAAVWLSLRDLLSGGGDEDRSRAALRLQGSWDDPIVVAAK